MFVLGINKKNLILYQTKQTNKIVSFKQLWCSNNQLTSLPN